MQSILQNINSRIKRPPLTWEDERVLRLLLVGLGAFNTADYLLTRLFLYMGYRELNPVMDMIVHTDYFTLAKLVSVPLMLYFLWWVRHSVGRRILAYVWFVFLVYLFLMVYFKLNLWLLTLSRPEIIALTGVSLPIFS